MRLRPPLISPYTLIGTDVFGKPVLRPIVPIEIAYFRKNKSDGFARKFALIDSGADRCIFKAEVGEELGIEIKRGELYKFGGVASGKELEGYIHKIGIEVGHFPIYTAEVVFTYNMSDINDCLLGQYGFFDKFAVKLDYRKNEIVIKDR